MSFFDTADDATDPTQNWGLLFSDLDPKPAYYAMEMWDQLAGSQLPVSLTPNQDGTDPVGGVGAVASAAANGTVKVLVWNFAPYDSSGVYGTTDPTPYDHPVTIKLTGLAHRSYDLSRTLIDASHDGSSAGEATVFGPSAHMTVTLAGEGVTLLTLVPAADGGVPSEALTHRNSNCTMDGRTRCGGDRG
jgi:hypothetical protein